MGRLATAAAALVGAAVLAAPRASASPLWDFVNAPNPEYAWFNTGFNITADGWTAYLLNLTSGAWLTPGDSDRYIWTHQLLVVVPTQVTTVFNSSAALWITGGGNGDGNPGAWDEDVLVCASLATSTGTVCSVLYQVPNQPVVFSADPSKKERSEDAAVAFTWVQYMVDHPDQPDWIIYFPMARAAVKAMDATTEFIASMMPTYNIKKWMVMGASKRGWTTWLTGAAAPDRVMGIAPVVMDLLNFSVGVQHMWQTLGNWTFAFQDYLDMQVPRYEAPLAIPALSMHPTTRSRTCRPSPRSYFGTPYVDTLAAVIDPLNYIQNLTMPKLVIDATGDEFFQVRCTTFAASVPRRALPRPSSVRRCKMISTGGASCRARRCA